MPADTEGKLILTEPVKEITVSRDQALGVLGVGQGPVTAGGTLRMATSSTLPLDADRALELLRQAGMEPSSAAVDERRENAESLETCLVGPSDRLATIAIRAEQRFLRDQQLRRWGSSCALCGHSLPKELVVAAHIKPRWACSESERMDI